MLHTFMTGFLSNLNLLRAYYFVLPFSFCEKIWCLCQRDFYIHEIFIYDFSMVMNITHAYVCDDK